MSLVRSGCRCSPNRDYLVVRKTGVFRADTVDDLSRICKKEVQDIFSETILVLSSVKYNNNNN